MTPHSTPGRHLGLVDEDERGVGGGGGAEAGPPSPRDDDEARVPHINHPPALSPRIPKYQDPKAIEDARAHRRAAIETLLHHYRDVLEGIPDKDRRASDDLLALMCPAWNHRSYRQLERRLEQLKAERPVLHAKVVTRYLRYSERRVAWCKKCGEHPASQVGDVHRHPPGRSVSLKPKLIRVLPDNDDPAGVELALDWLEARWVGRADLPRSVFEIEAERRLRAA